MRLAGHVSLRGTVRGVALLAASVLLPLCFDAFGASVEILVNSSSDDAEEDLSNNSVDLGSSDLELAYEEYGASAQAVGIRFTNVDVPQGARIANAYVRFTVDEPQVGSVPITIRGQAADNAPTFSAGSGDITGRPTTGRSVVWNPPDWIVEPAAGSAQRSPNIAGIVQEIVGRPGWTKNNALVLILTAGGTNYRETESWDGASDHGDPARAPLLHIDWVRPGEGVIEVHVNAPSDDAEQNLTDNTVDPGSGDLEMVWDGVDQAIGIRFAGVPLASAATVTAASVQFTVDEVSTGPVSLVVWGQAADDPPTFSATANDITSRPTTANSVAWNPPDWTAEGQAGAAHRTPDISPIIQEIIDRPGWAPGSALVIFVKGPGGTANNRAAMVFPAGPAVLRVEYVGREPDTGGTVIQLSSVEPPRRRAHAAAD